VAYIIKTTGERVLLEDISLESLQEAVGGFIQIVPLPKQKKVIVVNEEGKLEGLEPNLIATGMWTYDHGNTDIIVGDAVIADPDEIE
jgi:hypothetical protein